MARSLMWSEKWPNNVQSFGNKAPYNDGNHVVVKTSNFYVLMGHLQKGSITVR